MTDTHMLWYDELVVNIYCPYDEGFEDEHGENVFERHLKFVEKIKELAQSCLPKGWVAEVER